MLMNVTATLNMESERCWKEVEGPEYVTNGYGTLNLT